MQQQAEVEEYQPEQPNGMAHRRATGRVRVRHMAHTWGPWTERADR